MNIKYNFIDFLDLLQNCKFRNLLGMQKFDFLFKKN